MATQQGMSGLDVCSMLSELRAHLPLWFGKIYQYDTKTLGIRLNGEDKAKYYFIIEAGRRAHCLAELPPAPQNPSGFSMLLRKYLSGGKVLDIRQYGLQRIFEFIIGKKDTTFHLIIELFDEGNMVLCDSSYTIIKPLWHHRFKDRDVVPGVEYKIPGESRIPISPDEFKGVFSESDRDTIRTIAVDFMLGGRYAEEVCRIANVEKGIPAGAADTNALYFAYREIMEKARQTQEPIISSSGCWPFPLGTESIAKRFDTFNEALESYYPLTKKEIKEKKPPLTREERIRKQQHEAINTFTKKIQSLEKCVETIYSHYSLVSDVIHTLDDASRTHSWQDIEKILGTSDNPSARSVTRFYPAESAVELGLDEPVKIFVHETIEGNIGRYYDQIKKIKRKKAGAISAMKVPLKEKAPKKKEIPVLKPRWYHRFRWMYTSDGVLVIGGRDASQNEELVKRYMEGGDTFVHADVHGASVVILKGKTERMEEVVQFAASYSGAWKSGHFTADVFAVRPDQVSKTPQPGEYVTRGSFIVRGERTYFRNVALGIAVGVQYQPAMAVIGGPITSIQNRAKKIIILKPGTYGPNDIAKKILRLLRQDFTKEEWKGLKRIVNTEAIAAFVPSGGSDIVEST